MSDEAIAAIADALIYAYSDAVLCGSCRWADEMKDRAEYVLDGLRAAGFELYRPDECAAVGIGRWVEYEGRAVARMMTPPPPEIEPGTYRLVPVKGDS